MLDMGRVNSFMYHAEQVILATGEKDGAWNTILASIIAKASRIGTEDALEFVSRKAASGKLPKGRGRALAPAHQELLKDAVVRAPWEGVAWSGKCVGPV